MNMHFETEMAPRAAVANPGSPRARVRGAGWFLRTPLRRLGPGRILRGGTLKDAGRLPRYALISGLCLLGLWGAIGAYVTLAPKSYTSEVSLILPGAGSAASINLSDIGQASSSASSPYSGSSISPTVTYKRLLSANRVIEAAAGIVGIDQRAFGSPRIRLVDETSLIMFEVKAGSAEASQLHATALLNSFFSELDRLRNDEIARRAESVQAPIAEYENDVRKIRHQISKLQAESGLASIAQYEALLADTMALRGEVLKTQAAYRHAADQASALMVSLNVDPKLAGLTLRLHADTEFQELAQTVSTFASELAAAQGKYGDRHPKVVAARNSLGGARSRFYARASLVTGLDREVMDKSIDLSPDGERGALLATLVNATAKRDGLAAELAALEESYLQREADVQRLMAPASALDDLNRDYQVAEAVFTSALARTDTTKADVYASYPLVQVLEDASLPVEPSSPKKLIAIAAGICATFCLIVAVTLAWVRRPLIDRLTGAAKA